LARRALDVRSLGTAPGRPPLPLPVVQRRGAGPDTPGGRTCLARAPDPGDVPPDLLRLAAVPRREPPGGGTGHPPDVCALRPRIGGDGRVRAGAVLLRAPDDL